MDQVAAMLQAVRTRMITGLLTPGIARNDYDEETAYGSYMNPEPGFQSGPGGAVDAD